jgi:hypothetical protein
VTALQGLNGNTLVAGKRTAFRMFTDSQTFANARNVDATIVRPDGSTLVRRWNATAFISIANSSQGPSLVVRVAGADLPWVGAYGFEARVFDDAGALLAKFSLPAFGLLPTRDLIVGIDRIWASDANPGPPDEIQPARDAMERLAAIWPIRDGISQPDADRTAGLRYLINNNPIGRPNQDSQLCPFLASLYNKPPGTDVLNLGPQEASEADTGTEPKAGMKHGPSQQSTDGRASPRSTSIYGPTSSIRFAGAALLFEDRNPMRVTALVSVPQAPYSCLGNT